MSRPRCQLVAMDGNGSLLLDDGLSVSDYTRDVLSRVQDLGIPCVLVTGRGLQKARPTLKQAGLREYVITENGARAMRIQDGHAVYELWLSGDDAAEPLRRIKEKMPDGSSIAQLTSDGGVIEASHPWLQLSGERLEVAQQLFKHVVPDVAAAIAGDGDGSASARQCAKSYVTVEGSEDFAASMTEIRAAVGEGWDVRQIKQLLPGGCTNTCEVQSTRVNKADGLKALCEAIGVPTANVWAFGDDTNDARMLQEMGWGVRMANHQPGLDGVGEDVTARTNQEDGIAAYLEQHLLSGVGSGTDATAA